MTDAIVDARDARYITHPLRALLMQRIFQIASGYEDGNDQTRPQQVLASVTSGLQLARKEIHPALEQTGFLPGRRSTTQNIGQVEYVLFK